MDDILTKFAELGFQIWNWFGIEDNQNRSTAIATVVGVFITFMATIISAIWAIIVFSSKPPKNNLPHTPAEVSLTLETYTKSLETSIEKETKKLKKAHKKEQKQLRQQIEELENQLRDPEAALAKARETIASLEAALTREGNEVGNEQMAKARTALEAGDFSLADEIFAQIEAREQLAVGRVARAAFARGEIAEQQVRWAEAAEHYEKAAKMSPTADNIRKAQEFTLRAGDFDASLYWGKQLIPATIAEYGENSPNHAAALNNLASIYRLMRTYDTARLLYEESLKIAKKTIGENHPNYATALSNLANIYCDMGKTAKAEPLFLQAIKIDKATIGDNHPNYAAHLTNLALLYRKMTKYDGAEALYKKAIKVDKATIGENHPEYAIDLNNLALLYSDMGKPAQAEPLFLQAIGILEQSLGVNHPSMKKVQKNYAIFKAENGG